MGMVPVGQDSLIWEASNPRSPTTSKTGPLDLFLTATWIIRDEPLDFGGGAKDVYVRLLQRIHVLGRYQQPLTFLTCSTNFVGLSGSLTLEPSRADVTV